VNFEVIATEPFERKLKRLLKKHKSLQKDLEKVFDQLNTNPTLGILINQDCYKIRIAISSKGKGKSAGARIITYVRILNNRVFLLDIYDKAEQATISSKELKELVEIFSQDDV